MMRLLRHHDVHGRTDVSNSVSSVYSRKQDYRLARKFTDMLPSAHGNVLRMEIRSSRNLRHHDASLGASQPRACRPTRPTAHPSSNPASPHLRQPSIAASLIIYILGWGLAMA